MTDRRSKDTGREKDLGARTVALGENPELRESHTRKNEERDRFSSLPGWKKKKNL